MLCFFYTGINSEGHAANFVETEQIVQYNSFKASFVQVSQTTEIQSHPAAGKRTQKHVGFVIKEIITNLYLHKGNDAAYFQTAIWRKTMNKKINERSWLTSVFDLNFLTKHGLCFAFFLHCSSHLAVCIVTYFVFLCQRWDITQKVGRNQKHFYYYKWHSKALTIHPQNKSSGNYLKIVSFFYCGSFRGQIFLIKLGIKGVKSQTPKYFIMFWADWSLGWDWL